MKELLATIAIHLVIASTTHNVTISTVDVLMIYAHLVGGAKTVALVYINVVSDWLLVFCLFIVDIFINFTMSCHDCQLSDQTAHVQAIYQY